MSLLIFRNEQGWRPVTALVTGAVLPDIPMFGFYFVEKILHGETEQKLWSTLYFDDSWQLLFDVFNSIPIFLLIAVTCRFWKFRWGELLAVSALLHMICDLPVHHDDAHRHFLPLTHWRFESPVSYWDPKHYGVYFAIIELLFSMSACSYIAWNSKSRSMRLASLITLSLFVLALGFAFVFWMT